MALPAMHAGWVQRRLGGSGRDENPGRGSVHVVLDMRPVKQEVLSK